MEKSNKFVKIQNFLSVIWVILFLGVITANASQGLYSPGEGMSQSYYNVLPDSLSIITPMGQPQFKTPDSTYFTCSSLCCQSPPDPFLMLTSRLCVTGFPNDFSLVGPDSWINFGTLEKPGSKMVQTYNTCDISCFSNSNTYSDGWLFGRGIDGISTQNQWNAAFFPNTLYNTSLLHDIWSGGSSINIWNPMGLGGGASVSSATYYNCFKYETKNQITDKTYKYTCSTTGSTCGAMGSMIGCLPPGQA